MVVGVFMILFLSLSILLGVVQFIFSEDLYGDSQLTVLEAGFESLQSGVLLGSSFFSLVALFVLFDLELVFLVPGILGMFSCMSLVFWTLTIFIVIITLVFEWVWYGLKWQV